MPPEYERISINLSPEITLKHTIKEKNWEKTNNKNFLIESQEFYLEKKI